MPQRDSHDHALLLLSKAKADKLVLDKLADDSEIADDAVGFHAQQAVEKLLKAVLANRNVEYPRIHDIDRLVDLLEAHDGSLPSATAGRTHTLGNATALRRATRHGAPRPPTDTTAR